MLGLKSLIVAVVALVQAPVAKAPPVLSADEVVTKVQNYYQATDRLEASFRQSYNNVTFGKKSVNDGKVYILKPGKMRWDYKKPEKKHFISDGTTLWVYEPANKQAFKQNLADQVLPVAITFLYGKGDLKADFTAALDPGAYGGKGDYCVKLTPKQPSAQYKNLWLVVDATDFHVKESVILEASDNINHFTFTKIKLNNDATNVKPKLFTFKPPAGVKVVVPQNGGSAGGDNQ